MQTQIENLVSQLTGNATMFTAFDITMMLRRANPTTNIRHGEVRDIVHQLHSNNQIPGYVRTLQRMIGGQDAFVHHPYGSDPEDYDPNFLSTPSNSQSLQSSSGMTIQAVGNQQQTTTTISPTGSSANASSSASSNVSHVGSSLPDKPKRSRYRISSVPKDKFGRIRVPASVLRAAGFKPKDTVRVVLDPNLITVTPGTDAYGTRNGKKYVVDTYNNIRVHLKGKFPASNFRMQPNATRVYITPV